MKRIRKRTILLLVIAIALLFPSACTKKLENDGETTPEHVFRYAENQSADYPTTLGANRFAELVAQRTEGRIQIVVYHSAQLGSEVECIEQLRFGGIDFARISLSQLAEISLTMNVLLLPYLYRDEEHMWQVLDGSIGDYFLRNLEGENIIGLSWYNAGARSFYTTVPIRRVQDLQGLTIRVQESSMMADMVQLLGASAAPIVYSDVYSALQTGRIDGAENNWPSYESMSHYEVAQYFYQDQHTRIPEMQVISRSAMERLSEEDMEIILQCAKESALYEREEWAKREKRSEEIGRKYGVEVTVPTAEDLLLMQELCQPLYEQYAADCMDIVNEIIRLGSDDRTQNAA